MTAIQAPLAAASTSPSPPPSTASCSSSTGRSSSVVMSRPSTGDGEAGGRGGRGRGATTNLQRHPTQVALESCSARSVTNSVLAGYAAGVSGTLMGHPFDSLKVWMQTRDHHHAHAGRQQVHPVTAAAAARPPKPPAAAAATAGSAAASASASRLLSAAAAAAPQPSVSPPHAPASSEAAGRLSSAARRARALYAGMTGPLLSAGLIQSVNFAIYDSTRRVLYGLQHPEDDPARGGSGHGGMEYLHHDGLLNVAAASFVAGSIVSVLTSPLVITKVKQQTSPSRLPFRQALRDTMASPRTMFVGFPLHFASETFGRVVYYGTYESLKRWLVRRQSLHRPPDHVSEPPRSLLHPMGPARMASRTEASSSAGNFGAGRQPITLAERMGCAAASGILCWSVIFPIDAVRSRLFAQPSALLLSGRSATVRGMVRSIYERGGFRAFFRGFSVTVLRAGPVAATVLPIYDMTLEYLSGLS